MHGLKRIGWVMGQPLLPSHLSAFEGSLLHHAFRYRSALGIPSYGVGRLQWDETLLSQGVISIDQMFVVFPSGHLVDLPENGALSPLDLNKLGQGKVTLYLHLLKNSKREDEFLESGEDSITFAVYQMMLSTESAEPGVQSSFKFAEFEKNLEGHWHLLEDYIPPLTETFATPFLEAHLAHVRVLLSNFQSKLVPEVTSGSVHESYTLRTKFCLKEVAKLRRLLINMERRNLTHPLFLYESLCEFMDTIALIHGDKPDLELIAYNHDELGPLFARILESMSRLLEIKSEELASLPFEKKNNFYVIEKIPGEVSDAEEVYLVVQPMDTSSKVTIEGIKLASFSRLPNIVRFALNGAQILLKEHAPFNHNFSKEALVYLVSQDSEWNFALKEGKLAFSHQNAQTNLQGFLYWRR